MLFRITGIVAFAATLFLSYPKLGFSNIVGTNMQNFNITANSNDFITVYSSKTICHKCFGLGFFANYATNTLPYFEDVKDQTSGIFAGELALGYGLMSRWDVSVNLPFVINQSVGNEDAIHGEFTDKGINEVRLNTKVNMLKGDNAGLALIASVNFNTTDGNPYEGESPKPSFNAELAGDVTLGNFDFGLNVGYRKKNPDEDNVQPQVEPLKDQFIGSFAGAYNFKNINTKLVLEVLGSKSLKDTKDLSDRDHTVVEGLLGLKISAANNMKYYLGAGTEFTHSIASPDLRIFAGLHWFVDFNPPPPPPVEQKAAPAQPTSVTVKINMDKPDEVITVRDIRFQLNSDKLIGAENNQNLSDLVSKLKGRSFQLLLIEGHTCSLGSEKYNQNLSQRRADNIRSWLIRTHGFDPSKLKAIGEGESKPIASNKTESGRSLNRRVEFKIFLNK